MRSSKFIVLSILLLGLAFSGFQCASTELTSAKLYIQQKNYEKALESLKKEVAKNPKSDEGYYYLGSVYGELGDYTKMIDAFNKSLEISKQFEKNIVDGKKFYWANLFNKGVFYFQKGNASTVQDSTKMLYAKSIDSFESAVMIEPDSSDTYKNLAFVLLSAQKYDEAIKPLEKLIEKDKSVDGYKYLGEIYYDKGSKLKTKYQSTKDVKDSVSAQDYFNKAITLLTEARKLYPSNADILLVLSNSYIAANKIDIAIDAFKAGVKSEPNNKYYRYNYGVLLLGGNNFQEAADQFKKAIEIDSTYQNAIYNLAVTYVKWGSFLSKQLNEKGEIKNDEYKEKYQKALPYLEKVVQTKSDDAAAWELIGRVYAVLGMKDDATNAFNKADQLRK